MVVLLVAGGAVALFAAMSAVEDTVKQDFVEAFEQRGTATPPAAKGLEAGSLIRRGALAAALDAVSAERLGEPVVVRVAADRLDLQLRSRDGRLISVQVRPGPEVNVLSRSDPGFGSGAGVGGAIDPAAPERLVRAATRRSGKSAAQVDYLVLMHLGTPTWGLFFKDGTHYRGSASGRLRP